eukprot:GHRQ01030743.1.p2 GENE.GHRQ01030743.1~~GHRQ01030743.1.p2  ORF type:complete len:140 (-),score=54.53 GHRQ01030743.1:501-920(-)
MHVVSLHHIQCCTCCCWPAGTRLQFVDANHCPGAAMVVAHPPGGLPPVLHTGDARLTREATQQQPALQALVGRAVLVLDTTYADPSYCFPPQQQVLEWVLRAVQVGVAGWLVAWHKLVAALLSRKCTIPCNMGKQQLAA